MLTQRYLKPVLLCGAGILVTLGAEQTVLPVFAQATGPVAIPCETGSNEPCEVTDIKLVANPNDPAVYVLQVQTKQNLRSFVASRAILERFAKELQDAIEGRGVKNL
jgi:hypothetical protein